MGKSILLTKNKEEIIRDIYEQAYRTQMNYRGCSQVVVKALMDHLDMYSQEVFRAATPFVTGVARKGEMCGALSGALLAIGLYGGRNDIREAGAPKETGESPFSKTVDLAAEMFDRFKEFWGTIKCFDIQEMLVGKKLDVRDPDVQKMVKSGEYFDILSKQCCNVSASAAKIAAELILREIEKEKGWYRFDQRGDLNYKPPKK
jgi:C_GCAxxG_C_C family probable redox protein